jgi:hypothetical protein
MGLDEAPQLGEGYEVAIAACLGESEAPPMFQHARNFIDAACAVGHLTQHEHEQHSIERSRRKW